MDPRNRPVASVTRLAAALLALFPAACTSSVAPEDEERRLGLISGFNNDDPRVILPDTVQAGVEFGVQVTTYGNGCKRKGETQGELIGDTVVVTPNDYFNVGAGVCADILLSFVHEAVIVFEQEGEAHVRVVGRDRGVFPPEIMQVDHELFVRPARGPD